MRSDITRLIAFVIALTTVAPGLWAQASISGRVVERRGDQLIPVPECLTFAQSIERGGLSGVFSDGQGRFRLEFPPHERVFVATGCRGYRTAGANGRRGLRPTFDCSQQGPCGEVELELERMAVVDGFVVGPGGQPLEGIPVNLAVPAQVRDARMGQRFWRGGSDDRGYFRIHSVPPGEYLLWPEPGNSNGDGPSWEGDRVSLSLTSGSDASGIQVPLRLKPLAILRGRIANLPPGTERVTLQLSSDRGSSSVAVFVDENGVFSVEGIAAGSYQVSMQEVSEQDGATRVRQRYLGTAQTGDDPAPVSLEVRKPVVVEGHLAEVFWPEREDLRSDRNTVRMYLQQTNSGRRRTAFSAATAEAPNYAFRLEVQEPGEYRLNISGGPGPVVERVHSDGSREPFSGLLQLGHGDYVELNLAVRFAMGRLTILVSPAPGSAEAEQGLPAAHYVVGLRDGDRLMTYPTDQHGRLLLRYFPAGDWQTAAWPEIDPERLREDATWEAAGPAVRRLLQSEEADVEVTLTAVPDAQEVQR